ncbi:putative glutaredoxin-c4 precursor protein [Eutypa lata UCREL1]|uniref:Putative glutaredoxin-c4 protein n=1 Tax=Eutypa lata (strain UCR-EL1) TaxID=1287681 RepID=M7T4T9_EUTLA|nr:putative glutaredoxin-c4 precursor protein [Eutypa lata UCREL1]
MRQSAPQDTRTIQDFYHKTMNAMDHPHSGGQVVVGSKGSTSDPLIKDKDGDGSVDEDDEQLAREMTDRLRAAEQRAKDLANQKAPLKPDSPQKVVGVGSAAGGQNKKGKSRVGSTEEEDDATEADLELDTTLEEIFKKSLVIIFSKSFCPYSKRAKGVLLEKYSIDPPPYVVELDEHPLGAKIQARLGELTGRKTVPNIMINKKSIGGGDEIAELDARKTLIDKFKSMGGGKQFTMKERFVDKSKEI